jgi:ferrochelatase
MDPFVIDIAKPMRWGLVHGLIVPRRKHASAEAYSTIWTDQGSPLLTYLKDLVASVQASLGKAWVVTGGMRYGNPSIRSALAVLREQGVQCLVVLPLYPQYAESSSRSSIEKLHRELADMGWSPRLRVIPSFHDDDLQVQAWCELIQATWEKNSERREGDHLLFSYHGLPERHLKKTDASGEFCLDGGRPLRRESENRRYHCCERAVSGEGGASGCQALRVCYRAQSLATTKKIVALLGLRPDQWSISFQSRLGRTPWIRPYTDEVVPGLAKRGVQNLFVVTPSFTADCLETIEEIGDRAKAIFVEAGGRDLIRVPCLNTHPTWVRAICRIAEPQ